jgi:hypothetical protein
MSESKLVKLTGLWFNKQSNTFSGKMGSAQIVIAKNKYKTEDKHPDWVLFVAPPRKKEEPKPVEDVPPWA